MVQNEPKKLDRVKSLDMVGRGSKKTKNNRTSFMYVPNYADAF